MTVNRGLLIIGSIVLLVLGSSVLHKDMVTNRLRSEITVGSEFSLHKDLLPPAVNSYEGNFYKSPGKPIVSYGTTGRHPSAGNNTIKIKEYEIPYFLNELFGPLYVLIRADLKTGKVISLDLGETVYFHELRTVVG